jgi:hypothetical protein
MNRPASGRIAPNRSHVRCRDTYVLRAGHFASFLRTISATTLRAVDICALLSTALEELPAAKLPALRVDAGAVLEELLHDLGMTSSRSGI